MTTRRILVLSLAAAAVITAAVASVAMLASRPAPETGTSADPSRSPQGEPLPDPTGAETTSAPPAAAPAGPPAATPAPPAAPAPAPAPAPVAPPPPPPPAPVFPEGPGATIFTPRPGMDNPHPVSWRRAEILGERRVRLHYESGVAPCSVLDRVEVGYSASTITLTLYEGSDPAHPDVACIMIAQFKATDVTLAEPIGHRTLVDGSV